MRYIYYVIVTVMVFTLFSCVARNDDNLSFYENTIIEQEQKINDLSELVELLNNEIQTINYEIANLKDEINSINVLNQIITIEDNDYNFTRPTTYEEALEILDRLNIQNVILEYIVINDITYTVVEVRERAVEVGTDTETIIYDIPDISGNILLTLPFKNQIIVTMIAIIEETSPRDWGGGYEHWVKIRMEDGIFGWVRGEYINTNIGGLKYLTVRNIWLMENFISSQL